MSKIQIDTIKHSVNVLASAISCRNGEYRFNIRIDSTGTDDDVWVDVSGPKFRNGVRIPFEMLTKALNKLIEKRDHQLTAHRRKGKKK